jgi:hypothetical protein
MTNGNGTLQCFCSGFCIARLHGDAADNSDQWVSSALVPHCPDEGGQHRVVIEIQYLADSCTENDRRIKIRNREVRTKRLFSASLPWAKQ